MPRAPLPTIRRTMGSPTEDELRAAVASAGHALGVALESTGGDQAHPDVARPLQAYATAVSALAANEDAHDRELIRAQLRQTPEERLDGIARRTVAMRRLRAQ
jgi:hypothetical protein